MSDQRHSSGGGEARASTPTVLYVTSEDWYFLLHRLPMALAAQRAGYAVHVATNAGARTDEIRALGFVHHPIPFRRGSVNPYHLARTVRAVRAIYRQLRPDIVHSVALQPVVLGSLAATGLGVVRLNSLVGLGFTFTARTPKARLTAFLLRHSLRHVLNRAHSTIAVENPDDKAMLVSLGIDAERITIIPGSGVDTERFVPVPEPDGPVTAAFAGRLVGYKGVETLVAAQRLLADRGVAVRLLIAGEADQSNPNAVPAATIEEWRRQPGVTLLGRVSDIEEVWAAAHVAVQPSQGGEGLPVSLLEAAACGRALVATDVPGCREIARAGRNALVVAPNDAAGLADAIERLARDPALRRRFGAASRALVETEFSAERIGAITVAIYDRLTGRKAPDGGAG